jgi:hypothetical protein
MVAVVCGQIHGLRFKLEYLGKCEAKLESISFGESEGGGGVFVDYSSDPEVSSHSPVNGLYNPNVLYCICQYAMLFYSET